MERLWNSNYIKVMIANFSLFTAFYLLTPLLPLYLHETFGATKDVIGLVLSGYTITALLFRPFSGFFVDSFPRKTVLMVCFTAFAIFFAGYLAASTLLLFTIVRTLHGGPFGALTVANSTVAIDVLPSFRRNEGIGYYGLSNNLAMAIAPSFAVFIYAETHNFQLLFWLALIVATFGLIIDATVKLPQKAPVQAKRALSLDRFLVSASACLATISPSTANRSWASPAALALGLCSAPSDSFSRVCRAAVPCARAFLPTTPPKAWSSHSSATPYLY